MKRKPNGYWKNSYDHCYEAAKKFHSRSEFQKKNCGAYEASKANGWIESFSWLTGIPHDIESDKVDTVYLYEFIAQKAVYIGRTINVIETKRRHKSASFNDVVFRFAKEHNIEIPEMRILEQGLTILDGKAKEHFWKEYYSFAGYNVLNKAKTGRYSGSSGNLGSGFTKEVCYNLAKDCTTITEYSIRYSRAYQKSLENNWIKNYFWFVQTQKPKGFWTKERCCEVAKKCANMRDMQKKYPRAYDVSVKNKWIKEWFSLTRKPNGYWNNEELCYNAAKSCVTRKEFQQKFYAAYRWAMRNGWYEQYNWFQQKRVPDGFWDDKEHCYEQAKGCKTITEFERKAPKAYDSARENGWLDDWFIRNSKPRGYWTKERCIEVAKLCKTKGEFQKKYLRAYNVSRKNGWLSLYKWFVEVRKPNGYWTKERCYDLAKGCKSRIEFEKKQNSACCIARSKGWLDEWFPKAEE